MTHPHRWPRAAHKIAPNGALFPDISYYWLDCTERSRPFPTNPPKVRNRPVRFIYSLRLPPRGCARRRVSECNRRRRHLARRLKLSAKRTDEGRAFGISRLWATPGHPPLIRPCGATFPPRGKARSASRRCVKISENRNFENKRKQEHLQAFESKHGIN